MSRVPAIVACLCVTMPMVSGCPDPTDEGLVWTVTVVQRETLPGIPISVTVAVENRTQEEHPYYPFQPSGTLAVWIEHVEGGSRTTSRGGETGLYPVEKPPRLQPGERFAQKVWLLIRDEQMTQAAARPGPYTVGGKATIEVSRRPATEREWTILPSTEIQVRSPMGRDRKASNLFGEATSWMKSSDPSKWGAVPSRDYLEKLRKVAIDYGKTIYGKYARFMLACHYGTRLKSGLVQKEDEEWAVDLRRAAEILEELDADGAPENLRVELRLKLAWYSLNLGDRDRARAWIESVQADGLPEPLRSEHRGLSSALSR